MDRTIIDKQSQYLKGICNEHSLLEKIIENSVKQRIGLPQKRMKNIAKECIGINFKFQKKMLSEAELQNFLIEKENVKRNVQKLK